MKKKHIILLASLLITSCNNKYQKLFHSCGGYFADTEYVFPFNTSCSLTMYEEDKFDDTVTYFEDYINSMSKSLDRYHASNLDNDLYSLNKNRSITNCSKEVYETLKLSYELTVLTNHKYNMFIGELSDIYKSSLDSSNVSLMPSSEKISEVTNNINSIDYSSIISFDDSTKSITLNDTFYKPIISVGGIAKGMAVDYISSYLKASQIASIVNLGSSSISTNLDNPMNKNKTYKVGFVLPELNKQSLDISCYINLAGNYNISTSGDYENCYIYGDNKLMHHIINSNTGYSSNLYRSVTLISSNCSAGILDALSTAVFNSSSFDESINLIGLIEKTYNCKIDYLLLNPVQENNIKLWDKFGYIMSDGFNNIIDGKLNSKIIGGKICNTN